MDERVEELLGLLAENGTIAGAVKYDLHAIRNGWPTLGTYDMLTWWSIHMKLSEFTPEELVEMIGPATREG